MSIKQKNTKSVKKEDVNLEELRKPWLQKKTGILVIAVLSIAVTILVAVQIIMGSGDWGRGLLWGFIYGGSIWLVFYGMNWFHSLFRPKTDQADKAKDQK